MFKETCFIPHGIFKVIPFFSTLIFHTTLGIEKACEKEENIWPYFSMHLLGFSITLIILCILMFLIITF